MLNNEEEYIEQLEFVLSFTSGVSETEFLGESRIFLEKLIEAKPNLSIETMSKIKAYKELIDKAFSGW